MLLCTVTKVCQRPAALLWALLAGCAGGTGPYQPGALSPAQVELCTKIERAYRAADPGYPQLRDEAAQDPVVAGWLVRMFVVDLFKVREGRPLGKDEDLLRAAARLDDPVEVRAIGEIEALGEKAVPVLVGDLLRHSQPQPRELGIELLGRIGAPAVPALQQVARDGESRHRRAAARALGSIGVDAEVFVVLRELAADSDYTVRADALRSLRGGGDAARQLLLRHLRSDDDAFVRRTAAMSLAYFPGAPSALALVDHLERCKREGDIQSEKAAQVSLQALTGTRAMRTPEAWRVLAHRLPDAVETGSGTSGR